MRTDAFFTLVAILSTGIAIGCSPKHMGQSVVSDASNPNTTATNPSLPKPIAEFDIRTGPRLILVPVTIGSETTSFCLDTGASKTVFDQALRDLLGPTIGRTTVNTPAGLQQVELCNCPNATIGELPLTGVDSVACHDFTEIRCASGDEVYGVLGMDFLNKYAIEIDFDQAKLRLWDRTPEHWQNEWQRTEIALDQAGRPCIEGRLADSSETFLLDTGSNNTTVVSSFFDDLYKNGHMLTSSGHRAATAAGTILGKSGYVKQIGIGQFAHENIRVDRDAFSALGLRYLSRYRVRLDFPNNVAYFDKGSRYSMPDPTATSGLAIMQINGEKVICSIAEGSPAATTGIRPGDVIVEIAGQDANQCDMVQLGEILTDKPGATVPLQLRRQDQIFTANVELKSRLMR